VPVWLPASQLDAPPTTRLPVPPRTPPLSASEAIVEAPFSVSVPALMLVAAPALKLLATLRLPPVTASASSPRMERLLIVFRAGAVRDRLRAGDVDHDVVGEARQQRVGAPVRGDVPEARAPEPVDHRSVGRSGGVRHEPVVAGTTCAWNPPPLDAGDSRPRRRTR
jgi:hypothetical protein